LADGAAAKVTRRSLEMLHHVVMNAPPLEPSTQSARLVSEIGAVEIEGRGSAHGLATSVTSFLSYSIASSENGAGAMDVLARQPLMIALMSAFSSRIACEVSPFTSI
jgi:hypothetical protein